MIALSSILLLSLTYSLWRLGIGPTPSGRMARQMIIDIILAQLTEVRPRSVDTNQSLPTRPTIYELGSGWGGLTFMLAQYIQKKIDLKPSPSIKAYELSLVPFFWSALLLRIKYYFKYITMPVELSRRDLIESLDLLRSGDIVICYLCPQQMQRMSDNLQAEPPKGAWLITLTFALPQYDAVLVKRLDNLYRDPLYLYQI